MLGWSKGSSVVCAGKHFCAMLVTMLPTVQSFVGWLSFAK